MAINITITFIRSQIIEDLIGDCFPAFIDIYHGFLAGSLDSIEFTKQSMELVPPKLTDFHTALDKLISTTQRISDGNVSQSPKRNASSKSSRKSKGQNRKGTHQGDSSTAPPPELRSLPPQLISRGQKLGVVWHKWSDLRLRDHEPTVYAHREADVVVHIHIVEEGLLLGDARLSRILLCFLKT